MTTSKATFIAEQSSKDYTVRTRTPYGLMANNISIEPSCPSIFTINTDDIGDILVTVHSRTRNAESIYGKEYTIHYDLVPIAESLHQRKRYNDDLEFITLNMDIRIFLKKNLFMNPSYQRDFVWTEEQKVSYIENLFLEQAKIEPTIVHYYDDTKDIPEIYEVLDGKQRLNALMEYFDNKFAVKGFYFSDLTYSDQRYLTHKDVRYTEVRKRYTTKRPNEKSLIQLFLEINMLGTRMSEDDLNKAKALLAD